MVQDWGFSQGAEDLDCGQVRDSRRRVIITGGVVSGAKYRRGDGSEVVGDGVKIVGREMGLSHSMQKVYEIHD